MLTVDDWIALKAPPRIGVLMKELRHELDKLLWLMVDSPRIEFVSSSTAANAVIEAIVKLISSET